MNRLIVKSGGSLLSGVLTLSLGVSSSLLVVNEVSAQSAPHSAAGCQVLSKMREANRELNTAIATAKAKKASEETPEFDAEESGCISDYGANLGFGAVTSLAQGLLDQLKDAACSAMDSYIDSNISQLGASIQAPLGLGEIGVGLGKSESGELLSMSGEGREFGLDFDSIMSDVSDELPTYEGEQLEIDGNVYNDRVPGSGAVGDYGTQSRGQSIPTPDFNPEARR